MQTSSRWKAYYEKNRNRILESHKKPGFDDDDDEDREIALPVCKLTNQEIWKRIVERRKHRFDEDSDYYKDLNDSTRQGGE